MFPCSALFLVRGINYLKQEIDVVDFVINYQNVMSQCTDHSARHLPVDWCSFGRAGLYLSVYQYEVVCNRPLFPVPPPGFWGGSKFWSFRMDNDLLAQWRAQHCQRQLAHDNSRNDQRVENHI